MQLTGNKIYGDIISSINVALATNKVVLKYLKWAIRTHAVDVLETLLNANTKINFHGGNIGNEGVIALATALQNNITVTKIDLCSNTISNGGAKAMKEMVEKNNIVMVVNLQGYEIYNDVISLIEENLTFNKALSNPHL